MTIVVATQNNSLTSLEIFTVSHKEKVMLDQNFPSLNARNSPSIYL